MKKALNPWVFFILIAFVAGALIDRFIIQYPVLELDPKVNILSVVNILIGIIIAVLIPFSVNKLIEDKRGIKAFLVDEMKDLIKIVNVIKTTICEAHKTGTFTEEDRRKIVYTFHEAELKVNSIHQQVKESFKHKEADVKQALMDHLFKYDKYITGGELIHSTFNAVDERYYKESNTKHSEAETGFKTLLQQIHKF